MEKHLYYYTQHSQYSEPTNTPAVSYCEQEDEVHYHPDPFNGHEYIDLGLPSGTLWAKCNVGANSETNYGLYFAWGETIGYIATQVPSEKKFWWDNYRFNPSGDGLTITKYNETDGKTTLDAEDDAAHINWGGDWHMPTKAQYEELLNTTYVTNTWVENYQNSSVNGRLFTSVSNGSTLFIPAAGFCGENEAYDAGEYGYVWTSSFSMPSTNDVSGAWELGFGSDEMAIGSNARCFGESVRGVVTPAKNLITFTINGGTYQAEEGMIWQQWVNSSYNTEGWNINANSEVSSSTYTYLVNNVNSQDVIIANNNYSIIFTGGGSSN